MDATTVCPAAGRPWIGASASGSTSAKALDPNARAQQIGLRARQPIELGQRLTPQLRRIGGTVQLIGV